MGFRKRLPDAITLCKQAHGSLYIPKSGEELDELSTLMASLELTKSINWLWIGLELQNTFDRFFPPMLKGIDGSDAPNWLYVNPDGEDGHAIARSAGIRLRVPKTTASVWNPKQIMGLDKNEFFKIYPRHEYRYIRMKNGLWTITRNKLQLYTHLQKVAEFVILYKTQNNTFYITQTFT